MPYDRVDIDKVEPMTDKQYYVRGCTALFDAVGGAIHHIGNIHKYAREEDVPEKTIFIIMTDGLENHVCGIHVDQVRRMIERQKEKYHWEFIFLGANIDAVSEAARLGIDRSRAVNYEHDREGTQLNYRVLSDAVGCARRARTAMEMNAIFDSEETLSAIREDYQKRHKR